MVSIWDFDDIFQNILWKYFDLWFCFPSHFRIFSFVGLDCRDQKTSCVANANSCEIPAFKKLCPQTCMVCKCEDTFTDCPSDTSICKSDKDIQNACPNSCGMCDPCKNIIKSYSIRICHITFCQILLVYRNMNNILLYRWMQNKWRMLWRIGCSWHMHKSPMQVWQG